VLLVSVNPGQVWYVRGVNTTAKTILLVQGTPKDLHGTDVWQDVILIHIADVDGDLVVGFSTSALGDSSAAYLPRGVPVGPVRLGPGSVIRAVSLSGSRKVSVIVSPVPSGVSGVVKGAAGAAKGVC